VRVGPYRRAITLPDSLRNREVTDASLKQGRLRVTFEGGSGTDG
jgi:HSP20 family molecular chaperone IbpA